MNRKLLCVALVTSLVSINAFAGPVLKGKLISHKEWVTGNVKATYKDAPVSKNSKMRSQTKDGFNPQFIDASARVTEARAGKFQANHSDFNYIYAEGKSHVGIYSNSASPVLYTVVRGVCVMQIPEDDQSPVYPQNCSYVRDEISVDPSGGYYESDTLPGVSEVGLEPGKYRVGIYTEVSTDQNIIFSSSDETEVVVPDTLKK